eukprot:scaffold17400_cov110-Isochrysis_galbana.AAC.5
MARSCVVRASCANASARSANRLRVCTSKHYWGRRHTSIHIALKRQRYYRCNHEMLLYARYEHRGAALRASIGKNKHIYARLPVAMAAVHVHGGACSLAVLCWRRHWRPLRRARALGRSAFALLFPATDSIGLAPSCYCWCSTPRGLLLVGPPGRNPASGRPVGPCCRPAAAWRSAFGHAPEQRARLVQLEAEQDAGRRGLGAHRGDTERRRRARVQAAVRAGVVHDHHAPRRRGVDVRLERSA